MSASNVIVFGATGAVGGAAAREAAERGTKVWLAMRDPSKAIDWLTKEQEEKGIFTRIKADLTDPASVTAAIKESGAKSAFVYCVQGPDGIKPASQALKDAGITWVVLLSSFTVQGDPRQYESVNIIPYHHAQAEIALETAGIPFAAIRPGYFASNLFMWYIADIKEKNEVSLLYPEIVYDQIVPENIGQVAGALLLQPKPHLKPAEPEVVEVFGPTLVSQEDVIKKIGQLSGRDISIKSVTPEEYHAVLTKKGLPDIFANYLINQHTAQKEGDVYYGKYADGVANIHKYTGKQPIDFDEWLNSVKSDL